MTQGSGSEVSPEYAAAPETVSEARRFVSATLDGWGADADAATLLTSELATNAVIHARSVYTVTIERYDGQVRIGVVDRSPSQAHRRHYSSTSATGRGLAMVAELATAWGVDVVPDGGKCVWFELPLEPPEAAAAALAAAVEATVVGEIDIDGLLRDLRGAGEPDTGASTPRR